MLLARPCHRARRAGAEVGSAADQLTAAPDAPTLDPVVRRTRSTSVACNLLFLRRPVLAQYFRLLQYKVGGTGLLVGRLGRLRKKWSRRNCFFVPVARIFTRGRKHSLKPLAIRDVECYARQVWIIWRYLSAEFRFRIKPCWQGFFAIAVLF